MNEYEEIQEAHKPQWAQGRFLNELAFCKDFLTLFPMICSDGQFFSKEGHIPEPKIKKMIFDYLSLYISTGLGKKVNALTEALRMYCQREDLPPSETRIHCTNGYFNLMENRFVEKMDYCRFRLPVAYNPQAPAPRRWLAFLTDLLEEEDILTLQEFIGYCLLPVNYAQKMLLIIGRGGEGKSRIGIILQGLLGQAMVNGSLSKLETSSFSRADLQNRLLMVDDDLRLEGLKSTNYIKSIITAEQPLDLEKKGLQSYQGMLYCRLMAFGNGNLRSVHDRSYGFFRRQIILTAKLRPRDRQDDPFLAQTIRKEELEGILLWAIEGLQRLLDNDLKFTLSTAAKRNLLAAIAEGNNIMDFMKSQGYIRYDALAAITSRSLYSAYQDWCQDNMFTPLNAKTFVTWLIQHADEYDLVYSTHINGGNGRHVRGFTGITRCGF